MTDEIELEDDEVVGWIEEIRDSQKREENFEKQAKEVLEIYNSDNGTRTPFNVLYANTDIMLPALFSAMPRPSVRRRFPDDDELSQAVSQASNRMLSYMMDTNIDGYETFYDATKNAVIDALLPGRGITKVKIEAKGTDELQDAYVCTDSVEWDGVLFGYAKKWSKVPWIAFILHLTKKESIKLFGEDIANQLNYTTNNDDNDEKNEDKDRQDKHQGIKKTVKVYQIWDKEGGRVIRYVSEQYKKGYLLVQDDPVKLSGFYNIPKPLSFVSKSNDFLPTPLYSYYKEQAKELNLITRRIHKLINAIRVKFVYDTELKGDWIALANGSAEFQPFNINTLFDDDDENIGIPAQKPGTLENSKGFGNHIWFLPIEQMIKVLMQLYQAREQIKATAYEITGISDIIRGSSDAQETATAQGIKAQWGSLRLKDKQNEVARYVRDLMRLMLELASQYIPQDKWAKITSLPFASDEEVIQAQNALQMAQGMNPEMIQPEMQQQLQQAQSVVDGVKWSDVIGVLKDDLTRSYKVDIETNTTVMPEINEDTANMAQALSAMSQAVSELSPLIMQGVLPFETAQTLLLSIIRRYQLGDDVEEAIKQMQPPAPPQQPQDNTMQVEQLKAQIEQMRLEHEQKLKGAELQHDMDVENAKNAKEVQINRENLAAQNQIEQGKAATDMTIEQMRIEAERQFMAFSETMNHLNNQLEARNEPTEL